MKRLLIMCVLNLFAFGLQAQDQKISVIEFKAGAGLSQSDVDGISNIFITYFKPEGYKIIERVELDKVIIEQRLQVSSITEDNARVVAGHIENLSKLVFGSVNFAMGEYNVDVRVVDVKTGTVYPTAGISFPQAQYRNSMKQLAEELNSKMLIRESSVSKPKPEAKSVPMSSKFGRINMQEIVFEMAEFKEMQAKIKALSEDWSKQLEIIQVEFNNKYLEFEKGRANMSTAEVQIKHEELQTLQSRYAELQQIAQQDIEKQQSELIRPIQQKATNAVNKIAVEGGYLGVYDSSLPSLAYFDEAMIIDISEAVRKELGITH